MRLSSTSRFVFLSSVCLSVAALGCGDDEDDAGTSSGGSGGSGGATTPAGAGPQSSSTTVGGMGGMGPGGNGAGGSGAGGAGPGNVYEVASSLADYSVLVAAVDKAGLAPALQDPAATLTVFAPDNDAFSALLAAVGATSLDDLSADQLRPILAYHVLGVTVDAAAATTAAGNGDTVTGLGGTIQLGLDGTTIQLDATAAVEAADVPASNGIIHGIDAVVLPSVTDVVVSDPNFSSLEAALGVADQSSNSPGLVAALDDNDGTFTVFAPTDTAFAGLVTALSASPSTGIAALTDFAPHQLLPVIRYHYVAGAAVTSGTLASGPVTTAGGIATADTSNGVVIDAATVQTADLYTANGVIHVIDSVLLPSITDIVTTAPEFSELASAIAGADGDANTTPKVGAALNVGAATGSYTLFAPDDAAFGNITVPVVPQAVTNILLYHVLNEADPIYAADALALGGPTTFGTLLNENLAVAGGSGVTVVDGTSTLTNVGDADYFAENGVIHRVDKVLLPPVQ
ncbi:MAG: fasciclin domain-containing protein [Myxococcota bacterium]